MDWLELRGDHPRALFYHTVKEQRISPGRMSEQAVLDILWLRGVQAQVSAFSPHDFRRTLISNLNEAYDSKATSYQGNSLSHGNLGGISQRH